MKSSEHFQALDRVKARTRERFELPAEAVILVSEVGCSVPGCPPLETVVAFWTADGKRHEFKLFKPAEEVVYNDLPYAWLLASLAAPLAPECDCC